MNNLTGSEQIALLGVMPPASLAAQANASAWFPVKNFESILVIVQTGLLGAASTVDIKLRQATDAAGNGPAKDIAGKASTQIVKASGDNKQVMLNVRQEQLDVNNGYDHVGVTVTVGVDAALASVVILGIGGRYGPARLGNATSVAQIV